MCDESFRDEEDRRGRVHGQAGATPRSERRDRADHQSADLYIRLAYPGMIQRPAEERSPAASHWPERGQGERHDQAASYTWCYW
jgi:hypothetical protein